MKLFSTASIVLILLIGCASGPKPIGRTLDSRNDVTLEEIMEAGTIFDQQGNVYPVQGKPREMHLMPRAYVERLGKILKSEKTRATQLNEVFSLTCDGSTAKFGPKETIKAIIPRFQVGLALDDAQKQRASYVEAARDFIKQRFFALARRNHLKKVNRTAYIDKFKSESNTAMEFYALPGNTPSALVNFYKDAPLSNSDFALIYSPGNPNAYLVPHVYHHFRIVRETYDHYGSRGNRGLLSETVDKVQTGYSAFRVGLNKTNRYEEFPLFTVSKIGWEIGGTPAFPIDYFQYADLGFLEAAFTMVIPPDIQASLFKSKHGGHEICGTSDYCGFSQGKKFSAAKLLSDHDDLWDRYYRVFSDIQEGPNEDGSVITFDVSLRLDLFCEYGRAALDLKSE